MDKWYLFSVDYVCVWVYIGYMNEEEENEVMENDTFADERAELYEANEIFNDNSFNSNTWNE